MNRYVVWRPDYGQTQEDARVFEAHSHENACQKWAQRADADSADYLIVGGQDAEVMVAELGSSLPPFRYSVSGETVAEYRARLLPASAQEGLR